MSACSQPAWSGLGFGGGGAWSVRCDVERWSEGLPLIEVPRDLSAASLVSSSINIAAVVGSEAVQRRYRLLRPRNTTRKPIHSCPWERRWCVGERYRRRRRFACVQLPKHRLISPSPAPHAITETSPSKSIKALAPAPSTRHPTAPPSIKLCLRYPFLHQSCKVHSLHPTSSPISPPFRHSGFHSPAPNPYPAPP